MSPRWPIVFSCAVTMIGGCTRQPAPPPFTIEEATIGDLQSRLEAGHDTARSLAERYLARIEELDRKGPALHSVIEPNPDALTIANRLDAERRAGKVRGPLHGIPVLIDDNIATADRMMTTAGSLALEGSIAAQDAFVVSRLRAAGAVILGKTNLSEWANSRSNRSKNGPSGRDGQTKNPYALDHNPSGSNSGSAVAVAANLCAAAIGTGTDGSIVSPASVNGIVGIKPTLGLVSRTGIVPIAHGQDTASPMARTVADAAVILSVLAVADPADAITKNPVTIGPIDYTRFLIRTGLQGARIGVVRQKTGTTPAAAAVFDAAVADLRRLGADVVDPVEVPDRNILQQAEANGPLSDAKSLAGVEKIRRLAGPEGIDAVLQRHQLDALVAPTSAPAGITDYPPGDPEPSGISSVAAAAGYPHLTVPAGFVNGLPIGLSLVGTAWSEPALIRMAYAYEQGTRRRRPPSYLVTPPLAK